VASYVLPKMSSWSLDLAGIPFGVWQACSRGTEKINDV
jgi:hypothetical protein